MTTPKFNPGFSLSIISQSSQKTAEELLERNHKLFHCFFNAKGFHNHIAHDILASLALGASPRQLKLNYEKNAHYQRLLSGPKGADLENAWDKCLGREEYYCDFRDYFLEQIKQNGIPKTFEKFLFGQTELAKDMFVRFFAGLYHPFIHVGYGIEFDLPYIVAEGFAQTAIHGTHMKDYFQDCESKDNEGITILEAATRLNQSTQLADMKQRLEENDNMRENSRMVADLVANVVGKIGFDEDRIMQLTLDSVDVSANMFANSPNPKKLLKFDFVFLHSLTSSLFLSVFMQQSWISNKDKIRILRRKVAVDLLYYSIQGAPKLDLAFVKSYTATASTAPWLKIMESSFNYNDDGHLVKALRSLAHAQQLFNKFGYTNSFIHNENLWERIGEMAVASVRDFPNTMWVRSSGLDRGWADVPDRIN